MSRDLLRRVARVEVNRRVDGLRGLSDADLQARIDSSVREVVDGMGAQLRAGRPAPDVLAEVREVVGRFPETEAEILAALGLSPDEVPA